MESVLMVPIEIKRKLRRGMNIKLGLAVINDSVLVDHSDEKNSLTLNMFYGYDGNVISETIF